MFPIITKAQPLSIQAQINQAEPGDTIHIKPGEYRENLRINKPIHLIGAKDVYFIQAEVHPTITIDADQVTIENVTIKHQQKDNDTAAVLIRGNKNQLNEVAILTNHMGVHLDEADENVLKNISIVGDKNQKLVERQHGIYIWKANQTEINHSTISNVLDGVYLEKSNQTKLSSNTVFHSRYGYHLMFTKNTTLQHNHAYENISGMMIMGAEGPVVKQNKLAHHQRNIQSLGLLLFDTTNATIVENEIINNRIGILIEDAKENEFELNQIQGNYIGIQFKKAEENNFQYNAFTTNVVQGQAIESVNNTSNHNYWGDHLGLDKTGNGVSDLPYRIEPFFLGITKEFPAFQILFQSPGMVFLKQFLHTPIEQQLVDAAPLMENPITQRSLTNEHRFPVLLISMALFIFSIFIIILGVKVDEKI